MNRHSKFNPWGKASVDPCDEILIKGPSPKLEDVRRILHISTEFVKGFRAFLRSGPCATFFGSARFEDDHPYYELARKTASLMSLSGLTIMTGGGPGIMEAANRGARDVQGKSLGCNITLEHEQHPNKYLDNFVNFHYFFIRKVMLLRYSVAFIVCPGGFGTLDEFFETLTLVQTKKIKNFPIVMMGMNFWRPLKNFIFDTLLDNQTIGPQDLELLCFTDDPDEALAKVICHADAKFCLKKVVGATGFEPATTRPPV